MTKKEAYEIAKICLTADGYCPSCFDGLIEELEKTFQEFPWRDWQTQLQKERKIQLEEEWKQLEEEENENENKNN